MKPRCLQKAGLFLAPFMLLTSLPACSQSTMTRRVDIAAISHDANEKLTQPRFCGGELVGSGLENFLGALNSAIASDGSSPIRDSRLFAETTTLVAGAEAAKLHSKDIAHYSGRLPSREDWQAIASLLAAGKLYPVGYRGCILNNGKVAFTTDDAGELRLSSFDFDQKWEQ